MTEPLSIKGLNCSTCPNAPVKEINKRYDKFDTYKYFCRLKQVWIFGTAFNTMEITGCASHPLALQVLAAPVIAELKKHPEYCMRYEEAIKLLQGDTK